MLVSMTKQKLSYSRRDSFDIYNTSRDNQQNISNLQDAIDHHIAVENSCDLSVVEVSEVTDGIKSLKHDKCDGSEGMYSNHLLLSSEIFRELL